MIGMVQTGDMARGRQLVYCYITYLLCTQMSINRYL